MQATGSDRSWPGTFPQADDGRGGTTPVVAMGKPQPHRYTSCKDKDCQRVACLAYREGYRDGYDDGFPDGVAACPLGHI